MYVCWEQGRDIWWGGGGGREGGQGKCGKDHPPPSPPPSPFPLLPSPLTPLTPLPKKKKSVKQPSRTSGSSLASTRQANTNVYNPLCREFHIIFFNFLIFFVFCIRYFFLGVCFSFWFLQGSFFLLAWPATYTMQHAHLLSRIRTYSTCTCYTLHVTRTYVCMYTWTAHGDTHTCHTRSHAHAHDNIRYTPTVTLNQSCWNYFSPSSHSPIPSSSSSLSSLSSCSSFFIHQ